MAFFKNKRRRAKAKGKSHIQEIRSPYSHRRLFTNRKPLSKTGGKNYSGELKLSYKKSFPLKKWILIGGGIIALLIIVYTTVFTNFFLIRQWKIYGDDVIQENSKFEEYLKANENKNLVFLDTKKIETTIKNQYPEIENLTIKKVFPDTLVLDYDNFPDKANLLDIVGETQKKFIVNEIGLITQQDTENPNLPYITVKTDKVLELNNYALTQEKLDYILSAVYDYEEIFGMKVLNAEYKPREKEVHIKTERNFIIWLDINLTVQNQYAKLKKVLGELNIYTDSIEYIDLRISSANGDRVIFKRSR